MSFTRICDHCHQEINDKYLHIDYHHDKICIYKDFHIDCFNYKFSCDIRNIEENKQ